MHVVHLLYSAGWWTHRGRWYYCSHFRKTEFAQHLLRHSSSRVSIFPWTDISLGRTRLVQTSLHKRSNAFPIISLEPLCQGCERQRAKIRRENYVRLFAQHIKKCA